MLRGRLMLSLTASLCRVFMYNTQKTLTTNSWSVNQTTWLVQETGRMHLFSDSLVSPQHEHIECNCALTVI